MERSDARVVRIVAFVAGSSGTATRTIAAVEEMAAVLDGVRLELEVVDVLEHPDRAEEHRVIATPTVIRVAPMPKVRLVGDLSPRAQRGEIADMLFDP